MRLLIFILYTFGFIFARDVKFNVQSLNQTDQKVISLNPVRNYQNDNLNNEDMYFFLYQGYNLIFPIFYNYKCIFPNHIWF